MGERAKDRALGAPLRRLEKTRKEPARSPLADEMMRLQRTIGNRATTALMTRPGLTIGRDSDPLGRKADAMADHLMRSMRTPGGAQGVLPETTNSDTVRRLLDFDGQRLEVKSSKKATADHSTFTQLRQAHSDYNAVAQSDRRDPRKEEAYLQKMQKLRTTWVKKHAPEGFASNAQDNPKLNALVALNTAIVAELPKVNNRIIGIPLVKNCGLAPDLIEEMNQKDVEALIDVDGDLSSARLTQAEQRLTQLRPSLGGGTVDLIRSMLYRRHIGLLKASGMIDVYEKESFMLSDANEIALGRQQVQDYGTARAKELKGSPDEDEYKLHGRTLEDISAGVVKKRAGVPDQLQTVAKHLKNKSNMGAKIEEHEKSAPKEYAKSAQALQKLTDDEVGAILGYTTMLFPKFNTPLRGDLTQLQAGDKAMTKLAVSGLNKLPKFTGTAYRHGSNFPGYAQVTRKGAVVVDMAFVSSSVSQQSCATEAQDHEVLEVIQSKSGRNVALISAFGVTNGEVLFRPGTRFKVEDVVHKTNVGWTDARSNYYANQTSKMNEIKVVVYKREV